MGAAATCSHRAAHAAPLDSGPGPRRREDAECAQTSPRPLAKPVAGKRRRARRDTDPAPPVRPLGRRRPRRPEREDRPSPAKPSGDAAGARSLGPAAGARTTASATRAAAGNRVRRCRSTTSRRAAPPRWASASPGAARRRRPTDASRRQDGALSLPSRREPGHRRSLGTPSGRSGGVRESWQLLGAGRVGSRAPVGSARGGVARRPALETGCTRRYGTGRPAPARWRSDWIPTVPPVRAGV